jgi:hypothetical protein
VLAVVFCLLLSTCLFAKNRQDIQSSLESARQELHTSIAVEERVSSELGKLKASGNASPEIISDYELYLSKVKAIVTENSKIVEKMEALNSKYGKQEQPDELAPHDKSESVTVPGTTGEQAVEEVAEMDRQLDDSLAEFDEKLLKELDLIRAKSSEKMRDLAAEAEAAVERLREQGIDIDADSMEEAGDEHAESGQSSLDGSQKTETEDGGPETGAQGQIGEEGQGGEGRDDSELSSNGKSRSGSEGSKNHPKNRYNPGDDDIVARQLREAAEEEIDPELREKLWDEYEQYKKNSGG